MQLSLEIWEIFSEMQLFLQIPLACQTICEFSTFSYSLEQYDEDHILCSSVIMAYR